MSLDIWLESGPQPHHCEHCGSVTTRSETLHSQNITHNLNDMARAAGFYDALWRPDENGIVTAKQLADAIEPGLADMKSNPAKYKVHDSINGWGTYEGFIPWLNQLVDACRRNPDALVKVSR